ncbi:MAG TPA: Wzz/FepE/Etk N-terminal domain-containing protein [Bryobacteraceae bacterium]|jgi:succinoglycan biosynthesis transport protein ExoP|nr:Wzz/FepE/Etk N-terminal domain-containing protein [Bryobacteraceae bacterium]
MQPTEGTSISRRSLDIEDFIDIVRRHKGWIFGPFLFTLVVAVVGVYMWPDSYTSVAIVRIVPQQVPEQMVQAAVNQAMDQRLNSMAQTILSRSVLTNIINTFGLYPKERAQKPTEDLVEDMKLNKIRITPVATMTGGEQHRGVPAFSVQFSYENRLQAQKVVGDLVSRFIDESIRNRSSATYATTQFLKDQMEQAHKELDDIEAKLQAFQMANNGRLPDQMDANMRQLMTLQTQVQYLGGQISRANQDKLQMESGIQILKDSRAAVAKEQPIEQQTLAFQKQNEKLNEAERDVKAVQTQLDLLLQRYSENYPDVQTARGRLKVATQIRDELLKEDAAAKKVEAAPSDKPAPVRAANPVQVRELRDIDNRIRATQAAIEAKDMEIAGYNKQMVQANEAVKSYSGRVETIPAGAREYGDLLREKEIAREKYVKLDENLQKAQIAQDMEGRKQGETLELLDPASLPQTPTEPKRPMIIGMGAGIGLLLGILIAGALEMKDTSLKNLKDVRAYTQMAILGSIPLLENDFVVRRRKRLAWLGWTTASLAAVVIMSGSVVYYYVTKV